MKKIAFYQRKGGVGKSTFCYNIGYGFSRMNKKVGILDLDTQKDSSDFLGVFRPTRDNNGQIIESENKKIPGFDDLFKNSELNIKDCLIEARENLYIISSKDLKDTEITLNSNIRAERLFQSKLKDLEDTLDYLFFDCSPSSISKINDAALCSVDSIILPVQLEAACMKATANVSNYLADLFLSPNIIKAVIPNMYNGTKESERNMFLLKKLFDENIITSPLRARTKIKEAQRHGQTIFEYDTKTGKEFMEIFKKVVSLIG